MRLTVLDPRLKNCNPNDSHNYVSVSHLDVRGTWSMKDLLHVTERMDLAELANRLERKAKK